MGLFKRGKIYYGRVKNHVGVWVPKTLNTSDRLVALERYRELERREAIPSYRAAGETTLADACAEFVISREVKGCAKGTMDMYDVKLRHLKRLLGEKLPLSRLDATKVDKYIATRLREGEENEHDGIRNTIGKELTALRGLLKAAKRAGKFPFDLDEVLPSEWSTDAEPRRTALTPPQVARLLEKLVSPREWTDSRGRKYSREPASLSHAAMIAFIVATGARLGEAVRATRAQIDLEKGWVYFVISKTRKKGKREKHVAIDHLNEKLIDQVLAATSSKKTGPMFEPWGNIGRDLAAACADIEGIPLNRKGEPRVTPNDLRRTYSNWRREAGLDAQSLADSLGHVDSRMVERHYGKLRPEQLRDRVRAAIGMH